MRELLERWAQKKSTRCWVHPKKPHARVLLDGRWHLVEDDPAPRQLAIVVAAVVEAIEARGWHWSLQRGEFEKPFTGPGYCAMVRQHVESSQDTPAAALLSAYLAAVEGEG